MKYTVESYDQIIKGEVDLPNFEPMTAEQFCDAIAAGGHSFIPKWGSCLLKGRRGIWAQYFLSNYSNMGDGVDGSGYVCSYGGQSKNAIIGRFAICKHEKKLAPGANQLRGWHPGACVKCGLDMTIDSGD